MEAAAGPDRIREDSETRAEFKRPVSVSGQRNYRRRSPSSSSRSQSPVSSSGYRRGGHKRDRSLSPTSNHGYAIGNVSDIKKGKQAERSERSKRGDVSSLDGRDIVDHDSYGRYAKEKAGRYYGSQGENGANQSPERGYQHTVSDKSRGNKFKEKDRDLDAERVQDRGRRDSENEKDRDRYRERGREKDCYKGRDEYKGRERGRDREEYRDRERERHRDWNEREHSRHRDERRERERHRDTNDYKEKSKIHDNRESLKARHEGSEYRCDEARKGTLSGDGTIARCSLQGIDSANETKIKKEGVADHERQDKATSLKTSKAEERERKEIVDHMETKLDDTSPKDTKWGPESHRSNIIKGSMGSQNSEAAGDVASAKLAAMKAAQLVNQNLGMSGLMSTDQKKKLLWGSKKATEQVSTVSAVGNNHWETVQFADRERQEKFNKLMGVKGEKANEVKTGTDVAAFAEDRQKELQIDLEKQFTAGLRRRDGRTVGLGL